jgi:hypothetical protein
MGKSVIYSPGTNDRNSRNNSWRGAAFYRSRTGVAVWHAIFCRHRWREVVLERDDAGEFRAILPEGFTGKSPDKEMIGGIIDVLEAL